MITFKKNSPESKEGFQDCCHKIGFQAKRIEGPFQAETDMGIVTVDDGYLLLYEDGKMGVMRAKDFDKKYAIVGRQMYKAETITSNSNPVVKFERTVELAPESDEKPPENEEFLS